MKCYTVLIVVFCNLMFASCLTNNFNKSAKYNTSFYLCYIINKPVVVEFSNFSDLTEQDKIILNPFEYKFGYSKNNYLLIKLKVQIVDYYMTQSYYKGFINIKSALGDTNTVYLDSYLNYFNNIYLLIDKKNDGMLKILFDNFKEKKITIFEKSYIHIENENLTILLSSKLYEINRLANFEKLIRMDSIIIPEYKAKINIK